MKGVTIRFYLLASASPRCARIRLPRMTARQMADVMTLAYAGLGLRHLHQDSQ